MTKIFWKLEFTHVFCQYLETSTIFSNSLSIFCIIFCGGFCRNKAEEGQSAQQFITLFELSGLESIYDLFKMQSIKGSLDQESL